MYSLAIDTTQSFGQVALQAGKEVNVQKAEGENMQAEKVGVLLDQLLRENGLQFSDISKIYCLVGPGSFTGIRVGIAFVKGLVVGRDIEVVAVSNFLFYGASFLSEIKRFEEVNILIDSNKNSEFFCQKFSNGLIEKSEPEIVKLEDLEKKDSKNILHIGDFTKNNFLNAIDTRYKLLNIEAIFELEEFKINRELEPLYIRSTYVR